MSTKQQVMWSMVLLLGQKIPAHLIRLRQHRIP
jgi:hypothetical protein